MSNDNRFIFPSTSILAKMANRILNSSKFTNFRRNVMSPAPFLQLESDVHNVVYCSWCVPVTSVSSFLPPGVKIIESRGKTLFTILTYTHQHFGPSFSGKIRRFFPSPLQSNWRLYLSHLPDGTQVNGNVLFVKNIFNKSLYALGSRLFSDALPSHLAKTFTHNVHKNIYTTLIQGGEGSAPDFECIGIASDKWDRLWELSDFFKHPEEAVTYLTLQHTAITPVTNNSRLACALIDLPVDIKTAIPLKVNIPLHSSPFLREIVGEAKPFCFVIPSVHFTVLNETLLPD